MHIVAPGAPPFAPRPPRRRRLLRLLLLLLLTPPLLVLLWFLLAWLLPFPYPELPPPRPATRAILAADGTPLRLVLPPDTYDYRPLYVASTNDLVCQALMAVEDARFLRHRGIDPLAILRALFQNLLAGHRLSGASTLSTQVIRLLNPSPRTLPVKLREAFQATQLELRHSKTDILTAYLRLAPFGGNLIGIDAAADRYFATTPAALTLPEAALLAGLPQSPSRSRPDRRPDRALLRRAYVLDRMATCGYVTPDAATAAASADLHLRTTPPLPSLAPHFCDYIVHLLAATPPGGASAPAAPVRTTLSLPVQRLCENALRAHLASPPLASDPSLSGAVLVLSATNGAILAMVGAPDYASPNAGQVNACLAPRAVGSTLKPFLYALAFDRGLAAPASLLSDAPLAYPDFTPQNYSRLTSPPVSCREALVQSLNLPAVRLLQRLGLPTFHRFLATSLHLPIPHPPSHYGLALALGAPAFSPLSLATAYLALAHPAAPPAAATPFPAPALVTAPAAPAAFSPAAAYLVSDILSGPDRSFDATGHAADVPLPTVAWKTGTSAGLRDAWALAWNPEYVVAVWIGHPSGAPSPLLVGRTAATPLAWAIFRQLYPDNRAPAFPRPPDVETRTYCPLTGFLATPYCPPPHATDLAIRHRTPHLPCPLHRPAGPSAPAGPAAGTNAAPADAPAATDGSTATSPPLSILHPVSNATLLLPPPSPALDPRIPLTVSATLPGPFYWFLDDHFLAHAPSPLLWTPTPGPHRLVVLHPSGPAATSSFTILSPPRAVSEKM
ncbi:MAG: penicillin-binding protein 1C [Kiritimatiellae bacterium]|nr:penicillin-binding protein 1C [Kiritimatiellia bacterium]